MYAFSGERVRARSVQCVPYELFVTHQRIKRREHHILDCKSFLSTELDTLIIFSLAPLQSALSLLHVVVGCASERLDICFDAGNMFRYVCERVIESSALGVVARFRPFCL